MIHTSYYSGPIIGEGISISRRPPKNFTGTHLNMLAPSEELLKKWKLIEKKAKTAEVENYSTYLKNLYTVSYQPAFLNILRKNSEQITNWLNSTLSAGKPVTLLCYEKPNEPCHRHDVAEFLEKLSPGCYGGEVTLIAPQEVKKSAVVEQEKFLAEYPSLGDTVEVWSVLDKCWKAGTVINNHVPSLAPKGSIPSFVEVQVENQILKAFGLSSLRSSK